MLIKIFPENPNERHIRQVVSCLQKGGVVAIPTDSVYAFACDLKHQRAAERMAALKGRKLEKSLFSVCCPDLRLLAECTKPMPTPLFRQIKQYLPGPYTLILEANHNIPRYFQTKKRTIGIRVVQHSITQAIINELGNPIMTTSIKSIEQPELYLNDPELIFDHWGGRIDMVVDGGICEGIPSTVLDCTSGHVEMIREGKGKL